MSESIEIPLPLMHRIERLKIQPDEAPIDVITRLLDYYDDEDEIDAETDQRILKGLEDVDAGRHRPLREIAKEEGN